MSRKTCLGACAVVGAVSALWATQAGGATFTLFQDDFENTTTVPGKPDAPQAGLYPTVAPLIPEGQVVAAGAPNPDSPGTGANILKTYGKQRTYGQFSSVATGAGTIKFDMDYRLESGTAYAFGITGDAGGASLDGLKASIWIQINQDGNIQAYNGGWKTLAGINHTVGAWQHYTLEYVLNSNQFTLTAGGTPVTSTDLDGVTAVSNFTHAFVLGGTNTTLGFVDNMNVTFDAPEPAASSWNVDGDGNWSEAANWLGGVPNGEGTVANFGTVSTAAHTVTIDTPYSVGVVNFDNANAYTLAGTSTLTIDAGFGGGWLKVLNGSHSIAAPVALVDNTTVDVAAGQTLSVQHLRGKAVALSAGTLKMIAGVSANSADGASKLTAVSVAAGAVLDLTNNSLVIDYTGASVQEGIRLALEEGRITSSLGDANTRLGYGEASAVLGATGGTFAGQEADATAILVKFTYGGDSNLDGKVDVGDLGNLASNWQQAAAWTGGDFDYNGTVNVGDLGILATNWQQGVTTPTLGPSFQEALAALGLGGVSVPEPSALAAAGLSALGLVRRRRNRKA